MTTAVALLQQRRLAQARAEVDAQRLAQAVQQAKGEPGAPGAQGDQGEMGPMPDHEWRGTRLRFEKPDGTWGEFVELRGPKGARGDRGASGSGGNGSGGAGLDPSGLGMATDMPLPTEMLVQQGGAWVRATWAQIVGWLGGVVPPVGGGVILTEDGLGLLAEDGSTLVTESSTPSTAGLVLTEDGGVLLTEDANRLEME